MLLTAPRGASSTLTLPDEEATLRFATDLAGALEPGDLVTLSGPRGHVRDRIAAFRDAGVGTLMVMPMAFTREDRIAQLREVAELAA